MSDPVPRGLTLEQTHNERRDHAIEDQQQQVAQILNLLKNQARQAQPQTPPVGRPWHADLYHCPSSDDESNNTKGDLVIQVIELVEGEGGKRTITAK